ncbi:MAG TPA: hypothetical protein VML55_17560 [Planctomycetaceae bacterium]|nr:hypothetical protein [Planctomycetaceae bacterium]
MMVMEALGGFLISQIGFGSAIAYVPLQIHAIRNWRGGWRLGAFVPLLLMVPVFVITVVGLVQESNLWPIYLIFLAPVGTGYLVILLVIRRLVTPRPSELEANRRHGRTKE